MFVLGSYIRYLLKMKMQVHLAVLVMVYIRLSRVDSFIAYDCEDRSANVSVVSLRDVAACPADETEYSGKRTEVQIIQRNDIKLQRVKTCLIEVTRIVAHCGMHSHNLLVAGGLSEFVYPLGAEECRELHRHRSTTIFRHMVHQLLMNGTTAVSLTLAGVMNPDGSCEPGTYTEGDKTWSKVIVTASIQIHAQDYYAKVKMDSNELVLNNCVTYSYLVGYCLDSMNEETFWDIQPHLACDQGISLLYEGMADVITDKKLSKFAVVEHGDKVFALALTKTTTVCDREIWQTEHPKLLVVDTENQGKLTPRMELIAENTDLNAYVNSKLLYIEQAYKRALDKLYTDALQRRCQIRREVMKNRLLLAPLTPSALSSVVQNKRGYLGKVMGEVLYIVQCTPKIARVRRTERCYNELPVTVENSSYFMSPVTHILQGSAEQIECSQLLTPLYFIDNEWVGLTPNPVVKVTPIQLEVQEQQQLQFSRIQPIGISGLYTPEEISRVHKVLAFGNEREAVSNIIARRIVGMDTDDQGYATLQIFNKEEFKKLARGTLQYVWGWFTDIGMVMSGAIGVYVVLKAIKYLIGVVINGVAIYQTLGCGVSLIASLWNTLAVWLVHRHHTRRANQVDIEMTRMEEGTEAAFIPTAPEIDHVQPVTSTPILKNNGLYPQPPYFADVSSSSLCGNVSHWTLRKEET